MRIRRSSTPGPGGPRYAGAAAEMALILPVLVTIVLGCVDFGRFATFYIAVTNAAGTGAFYGATNPYTSTSYTTWQTEVKNAAAGEMGSMSGFNVNNVTATAVSDSGGDWRARCLVPCTFTTIITWPLLPSSITIQRQVDMRAIR